MDPQECSLVASVHAALRRAVCPAPSGRAPRPSPPPPHTLLYAFTHPLFSPPTPSSEVLQGLKPERE